jgi:hypothetical protein
VNLRRIPLRPEVQQNIAIAGFVLAVFVAGAVVVPADQARRIALREWDDERVKRARMETEQLPTLPTRVVAATAGSQETAQAVASLRLLAFRSGCSVVSFDAVPSRPGDAEALVWPEHIRMEISGPYPRVREFMVRLAAENRLMTVPEFSVARAAGKDTLADSVTAQMRIERYVTAVPMPARGALQTSSETP